MPLLKSDKAKNELSSKQRSLSVRERSALFLADGIRTREELIWLLQGDVGMVQKLIADGYLVPAESLSKQAAAKLTDFAASRPVPFPVAQDRASQRTILATLAGGVPSSFSGLDTNAKPAATSSSDTFEGKRSLATTRMFLFDMCERMFARRDPAMAEHFRELLRNAKNREAMLNASRVMLEEIEKVAGHARADSISERLAMMLPVETTPDLVL